MLRIETRHLCALLIPACASVPRQPLEPDVELERLAARALDAPELAEAVCPRVGLETSAWPPAELDLAALFAVALELRPEMGAALADVQAAQARVRTADTPPNPSLQLTPEYVTGAGVSDNWAVTVVLDLLHWPHQRRARQRALAEQEVVLAALESSERAWELYVEVRDALQRQRFERDELALARDELELRRRLVSSREALRAGGVGTGPELRREESAARTQAVETKVLEGRLAAARQQLATAVGLDARQLADRTLVAPDPPRSETAEERRALLLDRLDLRRTLAEYEATERALELELARQWPDVRLGPGYQYDLGDNRFQLGIGFELPLFDRNEGPVAEAVARREQVAARFRVEQGRALGEIATARVELDTARAVLDLADGAVAQQEARTRAAERAAEAGALDRLEALAVQLDLVTARRSRLGGRRSLVAARDRLEDALQRPLDPALLALARASAGPDVGASP